jgi:Ras-related C3 botulinum toxin substrate 1
MQSYKIVAVGDGATGKTSLLQTFATDKFPDLYEPTVFDNYSTTMLYNDSIMSLNLWDCAGQEDYKDMRKLSYPNTDVFVLCYSCISPASYNNLDRWVQEIKEYEPNARIVIVCTKVDCLKDPEVLEKCTEKSIQPLTTADVLKLNQKWPHISTVECSAKTGFNVKQVFYVAIDLIHRPPLDTTKQSCCVIA